jgi:hypothetical protein
MFYLVDTRDGFCECIDTDDWTQERVTHTQIDYAKSLGISFSVTDIQTPAILRLKATAGVTIKLDFWGWLGSVWFEGATTTISIRLSDIARGFTSDIMYISGICIFLIDDTIQFDKRYSFCSIEIPSSTNVSKVFIDLNSCSDEVATKFFNRYSNHPDMFIIASKHKGYYNYLLKYIASFTFTDADLVFLERAVMSDIDRFGTVFMQLMDTFASSFRSDFIAKNRGIKNAYALGDLQETLKLLGEANINLKKDFDTVGIYLRYLDFLPSSLYKRLEGLVAEIVLS